MTTTKTVSSDRGACEATQRSALDCVTARECDRGARARCSVDSSARAVTSDNSERDVASQDKQQRRQRHLGRADGWLRLMMDDVVPRSRGQSRRLHELRGDVEDREARWEQQQQQQQQQQNEATERERGAREARTRQMRGRDGHDAGRGRGWLARASDAQHGSRGSGSGSGSGGGGGGGGGAETLDEPLLADVDGRRRRWRRRSGGDDEAAAADVGDERGEKEAMREK